MGGALVEPQRDADPRHRQHKVADVVECGERRVDLALASGLPVLLQHDAAGVLDGHALQADCCGADECVDEEQLDQADCKR